MKKYYAYHTLLNLTWGPLPEPQGYPETLKNEHIVQLIQRYLYEIQWNAEN